MEFNATPLFEDVSYVINKKDRIALVGKNGAGKSTMLKILAGIQQPTSGVVAVPRECTIGYLPQVMVLSDERTVMQEAELAFEHIFEMQADIERMSQQLAERTDYDSEDYQKLIDRFTHENERFLMMGGTNYRAEVERTLQGLGFCREDFDRPTSEFSGGWRMRLNLAQALICRSDLLLLDEPINGLDPQGIVEIRDTILKLNKEKNMTIVISSHILEELSKIATDYGSIHHGELIEEITREELMERCGERIEIATGVPEQIVPILDRLGIQQYQIVDSGHVWVFEKMDRSAWLNRELIRAGADIRELKVCSEKLENYYLNLTGGAGHAEYH